MTELPVKKDYFVIDRILAPSITIGTTQANDPNNENSRLGIRYEEKGPIYRLESLREYNNCLEYSFEKEVQLTLCKVNEEIVMTLKTPERGAVVMPMDVRIRNFYKPIDMASEPLDKIKTLLK